MEIFSITMSPLKKADMWVKSGQVSATNNSCHNETSYKTRKKKHYSSATRRHGNFAGVHTLLRILLLSNIDTIL
jgi:hypothetical protein